MATCRAASPDRVSTKGQGKPDREKPPGRRVQYMEIIIFNSYLKMWGKRLGTKTLLQRSRFFPIDS